MDYYTDASVDPGYQVINKLVVAYPSSFGLVESASKVPWRSDEF